MGLKINLKPLEEEICDKYNLISMGVRFASNHMLLFTHNRFTLAFVDLSSICLRPCPRRISHTGRTKSEDVPPLHT